MHAQITLGTAMLVANCACGRECKATLDSYNQCIFDYTGTDHVAVIEIEAQAAITAYSEWSGIPADLLKRLYRSLEVDVIIEPGCPECLAKEAFAFTSIGQKSGSVTIKYDAWAVPWVFAEKDGCWASTSLSHEAIHVLNYIDLALVHDKPDQYYNEAEATGGHPHDVYFAPNSPGVQARNEREKLCVIAQ